MPEAKRGEGGWDLELGEREHKKHENDRWPSAAANRMCYITLHQGFNVLKISKNIKYHRLQIFYSNEIILCALRIDCVNLLWNLFKWSREGWLCSLPSMESRDDSSLLSYNWYYPGIVLTIFNRKQFTYNISIITCKLHGAVACDGNTACVKMINGMKTCVWQSNLSIWMYTKEGAKGTYF